VDTTDHRVGQQWEFRRERSGKWHWRHRSREGSLDEVSGEAFPSLDAAIEDAARNGFSYAAPSPSS
jgi:hypothetical protein